MTVCYLFCRKHWADWSVCANRWNVLKVSRNVSLFQELNECLENCVKRISYSVLAIEKNCNIMYCRVQYKTANNNKKMYSAPTSCLWSGTGQRTSSTSQAILPWSGSGDKILLHAWSNPGTYQLKYMRLLVFLPLPFLFLFHVVIVFILLLLLFLLPLFLLFLSLLLLLFLFKFIHYCMWDIDWKRLDRIHSYTFTSGLTKKQQQKTLQRHCEIEKENKYAKIKWESPLSAFVTLVLSSVYICFPIESSWDASLSYFRELLYHW